MAKFLIGVDEAGRGALAGPVAVGAFLMPTKALRTLPAQGFGKVRDSKQLTPKQRGGWFEKINEMEKRGLCRFAATLVGEGIIDRVGITEAVRRGIARSLRKLSSDALDALECEVLLDGLLRAPRKFTHQKTIIGGDESERVIALASIVAKVIRDRYMIRLAKKYPHYGFERHKGYGTRFHYERLRKCGLCDIHRRRFCKNFPGRVAVF